MLEECGPDRGGPCPAHEDPGAHRDPMTARNDPMVPAPAAGHGLAGSFQGPAISSGALTNSQTHPLTKQQDMPSIHEGAPQQRRGGAAPPPISDNNR